MDRSFAPNFQQSIQQSLQEIASQMGKPLNEVAAERLYQDANALLNHVPEPLIFVDNGYGYAGLSSSKAGTGPIVGLSRRLR
ncbi:hypothetical protein AVDCRST_MAG81-5287 [uncultured Synechococcales cyanobacterium]|uniref:Uncharacterized protein n=1 Tax=uncultured Synechococcales cyanobacterium TaxID=1936017 RepID=A0A6J4VYT7_9CYAN|nr:hypothetical protein AVDCRST_MAG81-5287 [uncultured Synechococcales cyanobacterium]